MSPYIIKMLYSLLFWTDHFIHMYSCQEYTKLGDLHPRVQERIKKLDPAEYSNMANPHNSSRYMCLAFWDNYILLSLSRLRLIHTVGNYKRKGCVLWLRPPFLKLLGEWALEEEIPRHTRASACTRAKLVARVWRKKKVTTKSLPAPWILTI